MMKYLLSAVVYFVAVICVAHFFAPPGYIWTQNTISDLGSQGHTNKWIMQAGFIGFGILLAVGLMLKWKALGRIDPPDVLILMYGLSILLTGFFCAMPMSSMPYSAQEAQIHSLFATVAGFALSAAILWYGIAASSTHERIYHFVFLILITAISLTFGLAEGGTIAVGKGIIQRVLYIVAFIWLAAR